MVYDAIVVGLGAVGSQALRGLARQGLGGRFLGVEGFRLGHGRGSSHGKTRIYRTAYFEHPGYVQWCQESVRIFREMEVEHGASLLQPCGTLLLEESADGKTLPPMCRASHDAAQEHGIDVDYLDASTLRERFPQFRGTAGMVGVLEPGAGFVRCERVLRAAHLEARAARHIDILEETRTVGWDYRSDGSLEVILRNEMDHDFRVATKRLLISMGGWTGQLLPSWAPHLRPTRQLQSFLQVREDRTELYGYDQMPTWVMFHPDYPLPQYGVPCDKEEPGCERWLKNAIHGRDDFLADPSQNPQQVTPAEIQEAWEASELVFDCNELCPSTYSFASIVPCFYTMTKDESFMIGTPKGYNNVFAVAGLSGHGFKMSPALGQMMVDYALGNDLAKWNLSFCSPSRFGV